jgi:pimeloyl-ACP methyl ester carboxylesterase
MSDRTSFTALLGLTALLLGACSAPQGNGAATPAEPAAKSTAMESPAAGDESSGSAPAAEGLPDVALPVAQGSDVDGMVDMGGHRLAVHCTGSGDPTAVILHGWIEEPGVISHGFYDALIDELSQDVRTCSYDRANVGDSDTVPGTQTPEMVVEDLDQLMQALGEPGPYVLIGQSAGGMVSSAYAVAHPDKVAGIVMVDASFDEEVTIEDVGMVPEGVSPCGPANRKADGERSLQKIDNCAMYTWAYERRDQRPEVPLVYLAAQREPWSGYTDFGHDFTEAIVPLQQSYAESWSPGKFEWVDAGHNIHLEKSEAVADAVRWVVDNRSE